VAHRRLRPVRLTDLCFKLQTLGCLPQSDIKDLQEASAEHADIERVYEALERGSRNHLRAFDARIEAAGETYEAQFLDQLDYDAIADS
jgi:hypothetical protein